MFGHLRRFLLLFGPLAFALFAACSGDSSDSSTTSYVQTLNAACSKTGGTVSSNGSQNCDYSASISYAPGPTISSTDTSGATAVANQNAAVSKECEYAAEVANIQCKFDKLSSDTSTCQSTAASLVNTLNSYVTSGQDVSENGSLYNSLLSTAKNSANGADCSTDFKNAYLTYMTAHEGALPNTKEGCDLLTSELKKFVTKYKSQVSPAGIAAMTALSTSFSAGAGSCPANTLAQILFANLGGSGGSSGGYTSFGGKSRTASDTGSGTGTGSGSSLFDATSLYSGSRRVSVEDSAKPDSVRPRGKASVTVPQGLRVYEDKGFRGFKTVY